MNFVERDGALVGFRPEHLLPKGAYANVASEPLVDFWFQVDRVENLGADRLLYGSLRDIPSDRKVIVNLPSTVRMAVEAGRAYELSIRRQDLKFFDKESGRRAAGQSWAGA
jgi:multiple sugar transport system ATP-binding protein